MTNGRLPSDDHCEFCKDWEAEQCRKRLSSPMYKRSKLVKSLDDIMSLIVRIRGDWTCIKCKRTYPPVISRTTGLPAQNIMTNSHFFGRGHWATRYDFDNTDPMCLFCHAKVENHKYEDVEGFNYEEYMIKKLGQARLDVLKMKSKMIMQYKEHQLLGLKEEMKPILLTLLDPYHERTILLP